MMQIPCQHPLPAAHPGAPVRHTTPHCHSQRSRHRRSESRSLAAVAVAEPVAAPEAVSQPEPEVQPPSSSGTLPSSEGSDPDVQYAFDFSRPKALRQRFDELLKNESVERKAGELVMGDVASVDNGGAWVDIGEKQPAYCPIEELCLAKIQRANLVVQPGGQREFLVTHVSKAHDRKYLPTKLSLAKLEEKVALQRYKQLMPLGVRLMVKISSANRSGYLCHPVDYPGFKDIGFIPSSMFAGHDAEKYEEQVGREVAVKIAQCIPAERKLIFTARIDGKMVQPGDLLTGRVESVQPYGAFLDLGDGLSGLLHNSQMSAKMVTADTVPSIVSKGNELQVVVLSVDSVAQKIAVSTRQLEPEAGDFLKNPQMVMKRAPEMAKAFRLRLRDLDKHLAEGGSPLDFNREVPAGGFDPQGPNAGGQGQQPYRGGFKGGYNKGPNQGPNQGANQRKPTISPARAEAAALVGQSV